MSLMEWLEQTALSEWVGTSLWGYPIMLTAHSVGMAIVVGVLFMLNMRIAGFFSSLEITPMRGLIKLAWAGFILNLASGVSLFASQATYFITHTAFLIKIGAIFLALINAAFLQNIIKNNATAWDVGEALSSTAKALSISALLLWSAAIIAGRLIAYL